jgi:DNA-binding NarL/FixJ family response regulator
VGGFPICAREEQTLKTLSIPRIDNSDAEDTRDGRRSSTSLRIKIGVVENDLLLREGLVALLNAVEEFECIGAWNQAQEALIDIQRLQPDVLLLDIEQMEPSGLTLLKPLPSISPPTHIFVTMNRLEECWETLNGQPLPPKRGAPALFSALQFKVCGARCEDGGFHCIAENIRKAYFGADGIDPADVTHVAQPHFRSLPDITAEKVQTESLTLREYQVIQLIAQGHSNKDIAKEMRLGYSTIKNYVSSILRKLELDGRTQVALLAHQWYGDLRLPLHPQ